MSLEKFPISDYIPQICQTLKESENRSIILTAETGSGKSTVFPLGLLSAFDGKILMTEPRRLAVLSVANRLSEQLGEECGKSVGYRIHLESKSSSQTRLEVLTEAILIRILQENPLLDGYNIVVLDEAHERSVNFDLCLAFLKEALEVRDDLFVVIMSATIDTDKFSNFLGGSQVCKVPGRTFPVTVEYEKDLTVEKAVLRELSKSSGNILVFLPGISDIRKVYAALESQISSDVQLCILHSSISLEEQKKVILPSAQQKVILSSAIAETSLTVPGVTCVIDSGYSKMARINPSTGMQSLESERESEFSAEQRKGRAGRLEKGKCIRLWSEFDVRKKEMEPEILRVDLSQVVLECADRGITDFNKIHWLDSPNKNLWFESTALLKELGLLDENGKITQKGKAALGMGISPRLASIALESQSEKAKKLLLKYGDYENKSSQLQTNFLNDIKRRLLKANYKPEVKLDEELIILAGFPDRIAKRISNACEKTEYQFANGKKAYLADTKITPEWIVAPDVICNSSNVRIYEFEQISDQKLQNFIKNRLKSVEICEFYDKKIKKTENLCYDKLVISSKNLPVTEQDYVKAWENEVLKNGLETLPLGKKSESLLVRTEFFWQQKPEFNKAKNCAGGLEEYLKLNVEEWLRPFVNGKSFGEEEVYNALYWFLNGSEIDKNVPEFLILPNKNKAKVSYEKLASPEDKNILVIRPVIEIIIQRVFGCFKTPEICGMKVLLRLLSPASRPLQITDDLENFWTTSWIEICKEMKGRYPKHNWDYRTL